jgi:S1-C subfamily serine protease
MKKFLLILIPILAIFVLAGVALTQSDSDEDSNSDRPHRSHSWIFPGSGMRLGVILSERGENGARIREVLPDSPAAKAGLREDDVIISIDGKKVDDPADVRDFLQDMDESKKVDIEVLRDGKQLKLSATPETHPMRMITRQIMRGNYLGVDLQEMNSDLASYFGTDAKSGVLVTRVERNSPAEKAGLRSGDVVTQFNGKKVSSADDLREALDDLEEGQDAKLTVLRHGKQQQIVAHPEKRSMSDLPGFREFRNLPEMGELREQLRDLPDRPEVRESMRDLREQLDDLKTQIDRDLKPEIEKLKRELEKLKNSD